MVCPKACYGDKYFITSLLISWTQYTLSEFADDEKLGGVVDTPGCAAIQMEFNRLEKWANRNLMKLIKGYASGDSIRERLFFLR